MIGTLLREIAALQPEMDRVRAIGMAKLAGGSLFSTPAAPAVNPAVSAGVSAGGAGGTVLPGVRAPGVAAMGRTRAPTGKTLGTMMEQSFRRTAPQMPALSELSKVMERMRSVIRV